MPIQEARYGLDDKPPVAVLLTLGLQHAALALAFLVYPLAIAQELKLASATTLAFLSSCVLGIAASTCLHYFRSPVGSGSLAVEIPTPIFLPAAIVAGGVGGLSAIAAISLLSGFTGVVFARLLRHMRALLPAEICGIAVLMLGVSLIRPGMLNAFGQTDPRDPVLLPALMVSIATITTMALISIYGSSRVKLLSLAGGVLVGVLTSIHFGLLGMPEWLRVVDAPSFAWPQIHVGFPRLDWSLVPLAVVMGLVLSVDNLGMLVGIQRQVDPAWHKLDQRQASGGLQVSGIGDIVAGLFGGMPTGISSANVGLAHATGAVSRVVALVTGLMLAAALFLPKIIVAISVVPHPVVGAIVVYSSVYMVVSGMTLILNRVLNDRRIFVIGFSIVLGLTSALLPGVYGNAPDLLRPILESPLAVSTFTAMLLTQLFRFGAALTTSFEIHLSDAQSESLQEMEVNQALRRALEKLAAEVGAAQPFLDRAMDITSELVAAMRIAGCAEAAMRLGARFEDERLEITRYMGRPVPIGTDVPAHATRDELPAEQPAGQIARLLRHVDRVMTSKHGEQQTLLLVYQP